MYKSLHVDIWLNTETNTNQYLQLTSRRAK